MILDETYKNMLILDESISCLKHTVYIPNLGESDCGLQLII